MHRQRVARTAAMFQVTASLRYLKRYVDPLPSAVPGTDVLTDLLASLRDEHGFAPATVANHQRTLRPFLEWLAAARLHHLPDFAPTRALWEALMCVEASLPKGDRQAVEEGDDVRGTKRGQSCAI
jgi:hypothetical protein